MLVPIDAHSQVKAAKISKVKAAAVKQPAADVTDSRIAYITSAEVPAHVSRVAGCKVPSPKLAGRWGARHARKHG